MIQAKQTMLVRLLIAHMGTTGNVTKSYHSLTRRCTPTQTVKAISILSPADYIWRGNSDWTGGEDGRRSLRSVKRVMSGQTGRQSREVCLNIFTLLNFPPASLTPSSSLSFQTMRPRRTESSREDGGRKREEGGCTGTLFNSTKSCSNKRSPTREPPQSGSQPGRLKIGSWAKEWERKRGRENKTGGERMAE